MTNWNTLDIDDIEQLTKEVEKIGNAKSGNSGSNFKGTGKEGTNERGVKTSNIQANAEDEEYDEIEQEEDDEQDEPEVEDSEEGNDESETDLEDTDSDGDSSRDAERASVSKDFEDYKRKAEEALADARRELEDARGRASKAEKDNGTLRASQLKAQRDSLDHEAKDLRTKIKAAKESGDTDIEIDLIEKLQEKTLRKLAIETAIEEASVEVEDKPETKTKEAPKAREAQGADVPEEAVKFLQRNKWIEGATPAIRNIVAATAQTLIDSKEDPAKVDFYDKLEKRLARALEDTDYKINPRVKPATTNKAKGSPVANKATATESDTRTKVIKGADGKTKVQVTKADIITAENLGMNTKDYMKAKIKTERANGGNAANWATIEVG